MAAIGNGQPESGKISWFGGPHDSGAGGAPASGLGWIPGISTYNHATLGGYWLAHLPNGHTAVLRQTDIGPAPWTGRNFDFTYNALPLLGYNEGNFPTDAHITAQYLGKSVPAQYAHLNISGGGQAQQGHPAHPQNGGSPGQPGTPGVSINVPAGADKIDTNQAIVDQLLRDRPIDTTGKVHTDNLLSNIVGAIASDKYTTPGTPAHTATIPGTPGTPGSLPTSRGGDVHPLQGWSLGRTDMGVDASANVGKPILAPNDSKFIGISPDWYHRQPYALYQLTAGPNKGKYWYVAEQITNIRQHDVARGQPVATFAPSGTGLEIGWGSHIPGRTLAQATTGYTEGQVTPAGSSFRKTYLS